MTKQQFTYAPPLRVDDHEPIAKLDSSQRLVEFRQEMDLVPEEALALRDWLNAVLGDEPNANQSLPDLHTRECATTMNSPGPFPCDCDAAEQMQALLSQRAKE